LIENGIFCITFRWWCHPLNDGSVYGQDHCVGCAEMSSFFTSSSLKPAGMARDFISRARLVPVLFALLALPLQGQAASGATTASASEPRRVVKVQSAVAKPAPKRQAARRVIIPAKPSVGMQAGLHRVNDPLSLRSSVAYVIDQETQEVLFSKNEEAVLPIASLTKLMTTLLISEAELSLDEPITITQDDVDTEKYSVSRLRVGTVLTRGELLHLALMASENRAANALGRTYPGGMDIFVTMMNAKAQLLGMQDTRFAEPTGLSSRNQSSARDLALLVDATSADPMLREFSTTRAYQVAVGRRKMMFANTNRLVLNQRWDIGLQKTGYISEAGQCLVMQVNVAGRKLIMVFLDSVGKLSRLGDAERVRRWVETNEAQQAGDGIQELASKT
jgi:D-alanyl-D-alanine endopeptidase (penicillin-binding protein 7)